MLTDSPAIIFGSDSLSPNGTHKGRQGRGLTIGMQGAFPLAEVLLLHGHVVVGNGEDGSLVASLATGASLARQTLLQEVERTLGMLQRGLVSPELRQRGAEIEVRAGGVVNFIRREFDFQRLVQVLQPWALSGEWFCT